MHQRVETTMTTSAHLQTCATFSQIALWDSLRLGAKRGITNRWAGKQRKLSS